MANANAGFTAVKTEHGNSPHITEYPLKSGVTLFRGDPVKLTSGEIDIAAAGDTIFGVAAEYVDEGEAKFNVGLATGALPGVPAADTALVWDDLDNTIFRTVLTASTVSVVGTVYDFTAGTGDATTRRGQSTLNTDDTSGGSWMSVGTADVAGTTVQLCKVKSSTAS